jgi:ubiquinone/menaquinone biosynthesis C-methylase UbiE
MTETIAAGPAGAAADAALKAKHRAMWALGNYPAVASEVIASFGPELVAACAIRRGDHVLDVAAGSGNVAIPAALAGANVLATDLTPELIAAGQRLAAARGAELEWREGDAEALPVADGEFDVVLSCVGVMFAPHHQRAADELVRACRSGGTIGLLSWTPEGFIGELFATMKPYAAPPPPGAQPAVLWGSEDHVGALLGDRVHSVETTRRKLRVARFGTPEDFRDFFKACYGPTVATYARIADQPHLVAALDSDLADLARRHDIGTDGSTVLEWEYLLLTARRQ